MNTKVLISNILWNVAYSLLAGFFCLYVLSFTGFLFHISINPFYPVISIIVSLITLFYSFKTENSSKISFLAGLIIYFSVLFFALKFANAFYDFSWDGRTYHQGNITLLSQGWNPVYDDIVIFTANLKSIAKNHLVWMENYPKFVEIIQTNIFILFKNIELAKMTNIVFAFILWGYSFYVLHKKYFEKINIVAKLLITFVLIANPVYIAQFTTFYIDIYVYILFMLILFAIIDAETQEEHNIKAFSVIVMSSVCLINVKLGGLYYFILTYLIYLFYLLLFKKHKEKAKLLLISGGIILLTGLLSGINPYFTNISKTRHPFYPLAGKNKHIDIVIDYQTPVALRPYNNLNKFLISTFARVSNFNGEHNEKIYLKRPFSFYRREIFNLGNADTRISGFGVYWSGILLLALLLACFVRFNKEEEKYLFLLVFSILTILTAANPYCWWARYVPHLWTIPAFITVCIFLNPNSNIFKKIFAYIILLIMIYNVSLQSFFVINNERVNHRNLNIIINRLKNYNKVIKIYTVHDWAIIEKFRENGIKFEFVDKDYFEKNRNDFSVMKIALWDKMYWDVK